MTIAPSSPGAAVVGAERQLLPTGFADAVHAEWPRYDIGYALAELIARQVEDNSAKGPSLTSPGHLHQTYYPTTPAVTWFGMVRAAGWNDQPGAAGSAESSGQSTSEGSRYDSWLENPNSQRNWRSGGNPYQQ